MPQRRRRAIAVIGAIALVVLVALAASCANDASSDESTTSQTAGNAADAVFAASMIPHHEDAIEMAQIALERTKREEIRTLAEGIISSQQEEIAILRDRLSELPSADPDADHMMDMAEMTALMDAEPFDRAFIDAMVPHHEGAIMMAEQQLDAGQDPVLRALAEEIIDEQAVEIDQMQMWREEWFGAPADSGHMMSGQGR